MKSNKPLTGKTAICFESRLSESAAVLLQKYGADVISAPSMQEVPLEKHHDVFRFGEKLFGGEVDILVCMTGVGTQMLIDTLQTRYEPEEILKALQKLTIVVRGPKPIRVLKKMNISFEVSAPEPNTWQELLGAMALYKTTADLREKTVAVQEYGEANEEFMEQLEKKGAEIIRIPVYRWALPDDTGPLLKGTRALLDGKVQISLFTSKTQIDHVMQVADREAMREPLQHALNKTFVASVGPVCTQGLNAHGINVDFEPSRPKLGVLVKEVSEHAPNIAG